MSNIISFMIPALVFTAATSAVAPLDTSLPFRYLREGIPLLMVSVKLEGQGPYDFIVDTGNGAYPLILSPALAKSLKVKSKPEPEAASVIVGLNKKIQAGKVKSFQIGNLECGPLPVGIAPAIAELSDRLHAKIDGNIGYEFLKDYTMTVDYKASTLTLGKDPIKGDSIPFMVEAKKPLIVLDAEVNGQPLRFVLDTGASANCISMEAAKKLDLPHGADVPLNFSADEKGFITTFNRLKVDGQDQMGVRAVAAGFVDQLSKVLGIQVDGVLGYNFCRQYKITIDYPRKRLLLEKS